MSEISRKEATEFLTMPKQINCTRDCKYKDNIGACNCKCSDAINKAISDMEKLEKIEQILNTSCVSDDETCTFNGECLAHKVYEIKKVINEV